MVSAVPSQAETIASDSPAQPEREQPIFSPPEVAPDTSAADLAQKKQLEEKAQAERLAAAKREAAREHKQEVARIAEEKRAELARQVEQRRSEAAAAAKAKVEKDKQAREQLAREKAERDKQEREKAEQQRKLREQAEAEQARLQRESELNSQIAAEERLAATKAGAAGQQYIRQITAQIERAWRRPPAATPGTQCEVHVTQVPGGVVTGVKVARCNRDDSVRQSIEDAAYRASPLPQPSDPALFDRDLTITFRPDN